MPHTFGSDTKMKYPVQISELEAALDRMSLAELKAIATVIPQKIEERQKSLVQRMLRRHGQDADASRNG